MVGFCIHNWRQYLLFVFKRGINLISGTNLKFKLMAWSKAQMLDQRQTITMIYHANYFCTLGTSINHVDSCGERFLTKWPLYWLCYIHLSLFNKSFYEGVKNTQKPDLVVYGCPTWSLFSHQGHKCIPFEVKEVLCFCQLIWWILINKNDNKTLSCKGADWCTHAIFEMSKLPR